MRAIRGPGDALRFHMERWHMIADAQDRMSGMAQGVPTNIRQYPLHFQQLVNLRAYMGTDASAVDFVDGLSITETNRLKYSDENLSKAFGLMQGEERALNRCETHYMSAAVMDGVQAWADMMDPEPLFESDLPVPEGLLVFERPIMMDDLHPETGETVPGLCVPIRAIGWQESDVSVAEGGLFPGVALMLYVAHEDWVDVYVPLLQELVAETVPAENIQQGAELGIYMSDFSGWAYERPWDGFHETVQSVRRFMLAYWRWTWQRILVTDDETPNRPLRRMQERIRFRPEDGHIKVLRLRRAERPRTDDDGEGDGGYASDYQWIVRGHKRRQWYPSLGPARKPDGSFNEASHRLIYIEPHTSGNPNGPLIVGHNVTTAVR